MAERVVVLLEAVQVEEREHDLRRRLVEAPLEVVEQLPAVAETGEDVGVAPRRGSGRASACSRRTSAPCARSRRGSTALASTSASGVDRTEVVVHEHGERRAGRSRPARRAAASPRSRRAAASTGGCHAAQASSTQPATQPRSVGDAVRVRADGRLVQVEAVADREDEQAGGDEAPGAAGPPAGDGERPDDDARSASGRRAGRRCWSRPRPCEPPIVLEDRLEDDRGADAPRRPAPPMTPSSQRLERSVRRANAAAARARRRRAGRPRGSRCRRSTGTAGWQVDRERPDRVPDPPGDDGRPDQYPRRTLARARQPARNAHDPGGEHKAVVEPIDDEVLHPGVDVDRELERARSECDGDQKQHGARAPTLRENPHTASIDQKSGPGSPYGVDR